MKIFHKWSHKEYNQISSPIAVYGRTWTKNERWLPRREKLLPGKILSQISGHRFSSLFLWNGTEFCRQEFFPHRVFLRQSFPLPGIGEWLRASLCAIPLSSLRESHWVTVSGLFSTPFFIYTQYYAISQNILCMILLNPMFHFNSSCCLQFFFT